MHHTHDYLDQSQKAEFFKKLEHLIWKYKIKSAVVLTWTQEENYRVRYSKG